MTHSTHFYDFMANIGLEKKPGYSFRSTARVLLYAPSHRQDRTYHSLCYTSHGALAGTRNCSLTDGDFLFLNDINILLELLQ